MATTTSAYPAQATDLALAPTATIADVLSGFEYHSELTGADVVEVAELLGIDFVAAPFTVEDLLLGLEVERELGYECAPSMVDAPDEDLVELGTIAVAHLQEQSDYYARLTQAKAPGDPPMPSHARLDVGAD